MRTDALVAELEAGRLHAALDVVDPEPLPGGHPLWAAPNLVLSPHVGGATTAMAPRPAALLHEQVAPSGGRGAAPARRGHGRGAAPALRPIRGTPVPPRGADGRSRS